MKAPLNQLHDILPGPDTGTDTNLILIVFFIVVSFMAIYFLHRIYKAWPCYKLFWKAKRELNFIFKNKKDNYIPAIIVLLKKTASHYWEREEFAGLHTRDWLTFLDSNSSCHFSKYSDEWESWSYSDMTISVKEKKEILHECKKWLKSIRSRRPL